MVEIHVRHGQASAETGWGLTAEGKRQAKAAAKYLQTHFQQDFRVGIHSELRRAVETAHSLALPGIEWSTDMRMTEVDWRGHHEPREFGPWQGVYDRVAAACEDWDTNDTGSDRVVVSHGGTMRMVRAYREGLTGSRYPLMYEKPYKYFTNCQIVIYVKNVHPDTGAPDPGQLWVKSVCPWDEGQFGHDWMRVVR